MYIFFKIRKSSQIVIFGSIAWNIKGWLRIYDSYLIYTQIWLNRPRDACKPPFLQLLPMDHGHIGCIKRFEKKSMLETSLYFHCWQAIRCGLQTHDLQHYVGHMYLKWFQGIYKLQTQWPSALN
jgi:hypothetical protein